MVTVESQLSELLVDTAIRGHAVAKDEPLEALRGVAALVVVFWHLLLGFAPGLPGVLLGFPPSMSWIGRPWYGFVNAGAAVGFFFVLSGFVLTRRGLQTDDADGLARGALKRWPRLAGTVGIACLVSWALFPLGLYRFQQAGSLSGSPWLAGFAYSPEGAAIVPSVWRALWEGVAGTFFTGSANYNSSIWTMRIEFTGSFLAFGIALALLRLRRPGARALLLGVSWVACFCVDPWLANFPLGVGLATLAAARRLPRLHAAWAPALLLLSYAAATFSDNSALNRWIYAHLHVAVPGPTMYGAGAVFALVAAESIPAVRKILSGTVARWLGRMSFPLYLLHIPVLCSAGSFAYLSVGGGRDGAAAAALATLAITALAAWPLAVFDVWWTRQVGRAAKRLAP